MHKNKKGRFHNYVYTTLRNMCMHTLPKWILLVFPGNTHVHLTLYYLFRDNEYMYTHVRSMERCTTTTYVLYGYTCARNAKNAYPPLEIYVYTLHLSVCVTFMFVYAYNHKQNVQIKK